MTASRRRLVRWAVAVVLPACVLLAAAGWLWQRGPTPQPPVVHLEDVEPVVARAVREEIDAVQRAPRSGAAWGRLGQVLRAHGFDEQAVARWAHAERFDPQAPRWPYYRGVVLLMQGDNTGLDALRRAAALADRFDPNNPDPRLTLAEMLLAHTDTQEAAQTLQVVARKHPDNPRLHFCQAVLAERAGNVDLAIRLFTRLTNHPCARQRASARLAVLYARLGQASQAAQSSQRAAHLPADERWPDEYWAELASLDVGGHTGVGEAEARSAEAHLIRAGALLRTGQNEQAEQALRKALALEPESVRGQYNLALAIFLQAQEQGKGGPDSARQAAVRYEEAIAVLKRAIALKPNDALSHLLLGRALLALDRSAAAVAALRTTAAVRPEDFHSHLYLGIALTANGQFGEARKCLERAAQTAPPDNPEPAQALQRLHEKEQSSGRVKE